jgi:hypothetical protein
MEMILTPEFHEMFPGENENIDKLLERIPSLLVIQLLSMFNAELYLTRREAEAQPKLFEFLLAPAC